MKNRAHCVLAAFVSSGLICSVAMAEESPPVVVGRRVDPDSVDRSNWRLKSAKDAIEKTKLVLGMASAVGCSAIAEILVLEEDDTPYLSKKLIGKPHWHVVLPDRKLELPSSPENYRDPYSRTFEVLLNPIDGRVIKLKSRWPDGVPQIDPEPDAASATEQLRGAGNEVYHGFPNEDPHISFIDAADSIQLGGAAPVMSKQISASYVMWSRVGRFKTPRPVWAITLRGVMPVMPREGMSREAVYQYRYVVDARTGEYLCGGNTPHPVRRVSPDRPHEGN